MRKRYGFTAMLDSVFESSDNKLFYRTDNGIEYCNGNNRMVTRVVRYLSDKLKDLDDKSDRIFADYLSEHGYDLIGTELHHSVDGHHRVMRIIA